METDDPNGGVLALDDARVSWALDGGVLHLYDFVPGASSLQPLVDAANTLANARFAAVIATSLWADDPLIARLCECGFERDWEEADVRHGKSARLAGLVREVS